MTGEASAIAVAAERLSVIEHKAMIQPPSEAIHHKPVFNAL